MSGAMSASPPRFVDRNAPLRLARAAELVFPDGGMTASGLRKEAAKGRLTIYRIANKDFATLAAIEDMLAACRVDQPKRPRTGPKGPAAAASRVALDSLLLNVKRQTGAVWTRNLASSDEAVPNRSPTPPGTFAM
jgi:hypothetical protein